MDRRYRAARADGQRGDSDRIGRRNALLCFAALSSVTTIPVLAALAHVKSGPAAFATAMSVVSLVATLAMPDTRRGGFMSAETG